MKLLIDIDDEYFVQIKNDTVGSMARAVYAIRNGVPYDERPQGEWILQYRDCGDEYYTCSICERAIEVENGLSLKDFPYCHCGAKMKGGAEE